MDPGDVINENVESLGISELITSLKSAFQNVFFSKVEAILVSRVEKLNREIEAKDKVIEQLKQENRMMDHNRKLENLVKLSAERECSDLKDSYSRLEIAYDERLTTIAEDKKTINELKRKICDLECAKLKAETEVEVYKGKFDEMETRLLRMEKDVIMLNGVSVGPMSRTNSRVSKEVVKLVKIKVEKRENVQGEADDSAGCHVPEDKVRDLDTAAGHGKPASEDIVEILDSDDDSAPCQIFSAEQMDTLTSMDNAHSRQAVTDSRNGVLKRKFSCFDVGEMKMETDQKFQNQKRKLLMDDLDSSSSSSSDSEEDVDPSVTFPKSFISKSLNQANKRWQSKADMVIAFRKNEQLCLEAICALYRQQLSVRKSTASSTTSHFLGFNKAAATRGTTLAKFLTDGDPLGKLRKSKRELMVYDQKGLEDCRSLAIEHSKQLFEIYQKQGDPLFSN